MSLHLTPSRIKSYLIADKILWVSFFAIIYVVHWVGQSNKSWQNKLKLKSVSYTRFLIEVQFVCKRVIWHFIFKIFTIRAKWKKIFCTFKIGKIHILCLFLLWVQNGFEPVQMFLDSAKKLYFMKWFGFLTQCPKCFIQSKNNWIGQKKFWTCPKSFWTNSDVTLTPHDVRWRWILN